MNQQWVNQQPVNQQPCNPAPEPCVVATVGSPPPWPQPQPPIEGRADIAITFLVYLLFFAWLGVRRGFRAELAVFLVGLLGWIGLEQFGDVVIRLFNLFGKFITFAAAGGLGAGGEDAFAALQSAPDIITSGASQSFLFVLWVIILVLTYVGSASATSSPRSRRDAVLLTPGSLIEALTGVFSGRFTFDRPAPPDARLTGWALLLGIANGLLFAAIFLPRLVALLAPEGSYLVGLPEQVNAFTVLAGGFSILLENLAALWRLVRPQGSLVLLIALTLFLVLVAATLRGSSSESRRESPRTNSRNS